MIDWTLSSRVLSSVFDSLRNLFLRGLSVLPLPARRRFWLGLMQIGRWLYEPENVFVQRLPFGFYSKASIYSMREASVMRLVAEKTTIKIPKVIDIFRYKQGSKQDIIIMTRSPGKFIQPMDMNEDQVQYLANQIRSCVNQLRCIPAPNTVIGGFNGTPVQDNRLEWGDVGPFPDLAAFNAFLDSDVPDRIARDPVVAEVHSRDYRIVLTHNDIGPLNVLVDEEYNITGVIDWGASGWYPEYWEYTNSISRHDHIRNWSAIMAAAFPEYDLELRAERILWLNSKHP